MDISIMFARDPDEANLPPERRAQLAALDCIAELGLEGATVRAIAAKANLNPAAVNYYFRSKDRLVETALRGAWTHISGDIEDILKSLDDPREGVAAATAFLVEGAYRYPKIIRAIFVEHPGLRVEAAEFFKGLFDRLAERSGGGRDRGLGSLLLVSFAVFIGFAGDAVGRLSELDLSKPETRRRLSADLASLLFSPAGDS